MDGYNVPSTYPRSFFEMFYMGTTEARKENKLDEFGMKINSKKLIFKQNDPFDFVYTNWVKLT
jgi:hypothetical protein